MLPHVLHLCTRKLAAASAASKIGFVGGVAVVSMGDDHGGSGRG